MSFKAVTKQALLYVLAATCLTGPSVPVRAQSADPRYYDIGTPTLTDLWVDPVNGRDSNSGLGRAQALRTLSEAWGRIPGGTALTTTGYRIMLMPGAYLEGSAPRLTRISKSGCSASVSSSPIRTPGQPSRLSWPTVPSTTSRLPSSR